MEPWVVIVLLVAVGLFVVLPLIILLGGAAIGGALYLFGLASEQGFIGLAVYIAVWVFMFPVMLGICIIIGLFLMFSGD